MISKKAKTDLVDKIKYACDDPPKCRSISARGGRESGVVLVGDSGWKDDGGMGGYADAMLQKGQNVIEDMVCWLCCECRIDVA